MRIKIEKQEIQKRPNETKRKVSHQHINQNKLQFSQYDPHFPQALSSIGNDIRTDLNIQWKPVQQLCTNARYSTGIQNLQTPQYCNLAITQCLLILNWFVPKIFADIFCQRIVTNNQNYQFTVYVNGIIIKLSINSKIPLKDGNILFADPINSSIFPSIFQKLLAKIYGSYQQISDNIIDLLQICTGYCLQNFPPYQHSPQQFSQYLQDSFENNNLVFFKTRNSVRLQNFGMTSNKIYLITRLIKFNSICLIQFLEINQKRVFWGKYSKSSLFWSGKDELIKKFMVNLDKGCKENYIGLKQVLKICRQVIILHNTEKYNQNWLVSSSQKLKHTFKLNLRQSQFSHVMISFHFNRTKCRSCVYLICNQTCQLVSGSFKQNKSNNFIAAIINSNYTYILFVYCEDPSSKPMPTNVSIHSQSGWCEITQINTNISIQQRAFLNFIGNLHIPCTYLTDEEKKKKNIIRVKNLHTQFGMGIIETFLQPDFGSKVLIQLNKQKLNSFGIQLINSQSQKITYEGPCNGILLFKIKGKFNSGDSFPPKECVKIYLEATERIQKLIMS